MPISPESISQILVFGIIAPIHVELEKNFCKIFVFLIYKL